MLTYADKRGEWVQKSKNLGDIIWERSFMDVYNFNLGSLSPVVQKLGGMSNFVHTSPQNDLIRPPTPPEKGKCFLHDFGLINSNMFNHSLD